MEGIMIEVIGKEEMFGPKILVVGVGGGGNNAVNRMIDSAVRGVQFAAINTDAQVLKSSKADIKLQIGSKLTGGYGAGADVAIGEASAAESEEEIQAMVENTDLVIITCGMGGGTGTGATPVIAKIGKNMGVLTLAVVTEPFVFEGELRALAAKSGIQRVKEYVDTLLVIPNEKLITLSEKPLELEDAFVEVDSVLKYTIEGITNIVYNQGTINIDFNDLKTTLTRKGIGHLGIGIVESGGSILEATKMAINSPFLETSIEGASNLLINSCGKVSITALNDALSYVHEIVGKNVNIIWGTVRGEDFDEDKIVVTLIATGMSEKKAEEERSKIKNTQEKERFKMYEPIYSSENRKEISIEIPPFLIKHTKNKL